MVSLTWFTTQFFVLVSKQLIKDFHGIFTIFYVMLRTMYTEKVLNTLILIFYFINKSGFHTIRANERGVFSYFIIPIKIS